KTPVSYANVSRPKSINAATLYVLHDKDPAGTVVVAVYGDVERANEAYSKSKLEMSLITDMSGDKIAEFTDIGKQAIEYTATSHASHSSHASGSAAGAPLTRSRGSRVELDSRSNTGDRSSFLASWCVAAFSGADVSTGDLGVNVQIAIVVPLV